jgi:hypothetical protein
VTNEDLADVVIERLNSLIEDEPARAALEKLCCGFRLDLPDDELADHPTIQILGSNDGKFSLGFLGMLNGIVGSIEGGELNRCGYIAAVYNKPEEDSPLEDHELDHFVRYDK